MIGIFGSAFNPPTLGHLDAILQGLAVCDEVWLVPAVAHAFGKAMLPFEQRWAMVQRFVQDIGDSRITASAVEPRLWEGQGAVYTVEVLRELQSQHPEETFAFLCGPDNIAQFDRFAGAEEIRRRWDVIALTEHHDIRSTLVRNGRRAGQSISGWVTPSVLEFIQGHRLYV